MLGGLDEVLEKAWSAVPGRQAGTCALYHPHPEPLAWQLGHESALAAQFGQVPEPLLTAREHVERSELDSVQRLESDTLVEALGVPAHHEQLAMVSCAHDPQSELALQATSQELALKLIDGQLPHGVLPSAPTSMQVFEVAHHPHLPELLARHDVHVLASEHEVAGHWLASVLRHVAESLQAVRDGKGGSQLEVLDGPLLKHIWLDGHHEHPGDPAHAEHDVRSEQTLGLQVLLSLNTHWFSEHDAKGLPTALQAKTLCCDEHHWHPLEERQAPQVPTLSHLSQTATATRRMRVIAIEVRTICLE